MDSQSNNKILTRTIVIVVLVLAGLGFWINHKQANTYRQLNATATYWDNKLAAKQKKVNKAALIAGHKTTSFKQSFNQLEHMEIVNDDTDHLFQILENYSNSDQYDARQVKSAKYLSPSLQKSNYFFASDKDENGDSIVDAEGLMSKFVSVNAAVNPNDDSDVLIRSTWDSGYKDTPDHAQREIDLYNADYDYSSGKFTKIDLFCDLNQYDVGR